MADEIKKNDGIVAIKKPNECSEIELRSFLDYVRLGDEVTTYGLAARIKDAESLVYLTQKGELKGVAAVKKPNLNYKESVFQQAKATAQAGNYLFELGWVFVTKSSRRSGLSYKLVDTALSTTKGELIYSTTRSDNIPMQTVLKFYGFSCHGNAYPSSNGRHELVLYIRNND